MLEVQVQLLTAWWHATALARNHVSRMKEGERGEITATTALIVILVVAAIAAGGVIALKIANNAANVPEP